MIALAEAFEELLGGLDRLEIPYFVGGSLASSVHGLPRQTNDLDLVVDLPPDQVGVFCEALDPAFYADPMAAQRAIEFNSAFNVIHLRAAVKFDLFPVGQNRFARSELARRRYATTTLPGLENVEFAVASAEDTILAKLVWFRNGQETSDRQWHDILGVIHVQADRLDHAYLTEWASALGVADLLAKALIKPA